MAYCLQTDLEKAITLDILVQLTDDLFTGSINTDNLNQCIENADSLINAYLRPIYFVPVINPPNVLKSLSISVSLYNLYKRRASVFGGCPEWVMLQYTDAIKQLKDIRNGNMHLDVDPQPTASSAQIAEASTVPVAVYTDTTLQDW